MYTVTSDMKTYKHVTNLEDSLDRVGESLQGDAPLYVTWCDGTHQEGEICKFIGYTSQAQTP